MMSKFIRYLVPFFLLAASPIFQAQEKASDARRVVIAPFAGTNASEVLTDLLLQTANASRPQHYKPMLPGEILKKLLAQHRAQIASGQMPEEALKDIEKREFGAKWMLLAKAGRLGATNIITATLVDLHTFQLKKAWKVKNTGSEDKILDLVPALWKKMNSWAEPDPVGYVGCRHFAFTVIHDKDGRWQQTNVLVSNKLYRIVLEIKRKIYVYGFQEDSSGTLFRVYPQPEPDFTPPYEFANPSPPGRYFIPQSAAFALDETLGVEKFYFLYSLFALRDPRKILEKHLSGEKMYKGVVCKVVGHE